MSHLPWAASARVVLGALALAIAWLGLGWSLERLVIFPRRVAGPGFPSRADGFESLWIEIPAGQVEAWLLPGRGAKGKAVIYAHGNAELIDFQVDLARAYHDRGFTVLLPEYRGYGRSSGTPSESGIVLDFTRFHDLLAARPEVDPRKIVFHGRSLGGAVVAQLAAVRRPAALILQSSFTSVARLARGYLIPAFLVRDPFDTLSVLPELDVPVLIVHGKRDRTIPASEADELQRASRSSRRVLLDRDHDDWAPDDPALWTEVDAFLGASGVPPLPRP
ncbi:MAG: alpha/beta hydrolase [Acidobacteriia bacterium]|nr:alpha/beta hydrolase [Terriglobia bacterium]